MYKQITIAIDDGHGVETAGKRTPLFANGKFMHENEFNNAVAQLVKINLERCGFKTIMVAPSDKDIPLAERTAAANSAKADFYISIHANAMTGSWGEASGIETYHYPGSTKGQAAAEIIHKQLIKGTPLKDRCVKSAKFYVLKYTNMPAVLVECGFMDNLKEATLLLSGAYRKECADEISKGICEYFKVAWVEEKLETDVKQAIEILEQKGFINKPDYWLSCVGKVRYLDNLLIKIAEEMNGGRE